MAAAEISPRGVIWDVDGTIVDSSQYHWRAWKTALAAEDYAMTREDFDRTFGLRNDSILRMLLGEDVTAETIRRVETAKEADYRRQVREQGIVLLPGVLHWLERLAGDRWRQAVGSSAPKANVDLVLEVTGIGGFFAAVLNGGDVRKGKPDPEVYFAAAARLGAPIERCIVVEDAPEAVRGSVAAGIKTIGVGSVGNGADVEVERLDQLPENAFDRLVRP